MCGIAGILRITSKDAAREALARPHRDAIPEAWLDVLDGAIAHRGPDGSGRFRDRAVRADGSVADVALVHRRLSVIDPAGGAQPMVSRGAGGEEGAVAVVFNGCIYNHRKLRDMLIERGYRFSSDHSDTEVILHGWRQWGNRIAGLWERFDGMFALGLWDSREGRLVLARDRYGEKPLYYGSWREDEGTETYVFASTAAAVMRLVMHASGRRLDATPEGLETWLRFGWGRGMSGFVEKLPAWSKIDLSRGKPADYRGELLREDREPLERRDSLSLLHLKAFLQWAVRSRLESDVPLGCFLSGGVDSSVIAAIAKEERGSLKTFTVRMPAPAYDESKYAEAVAKAIGTEHHTLDCEANPAEDMKLLIEQIGLPFGDSSLLPSYWVSKAARRHVTVALSGDGGDELFVGYERYKAAAYLKQYGWALRTIPAGLLSAANPRSRSAKLRRLVEAARYGQYTELISIFPTPMLHKLMPSVKGHEPAVVRGMNEALWHDMNFYLSGDLLRKTDTASMAVGLEVRCPMLEPRLAAACLSAPLRDLMPGGRLKGLLKDVAARYVPRELIDRPKMGFAIPVGEWFRNDYGGMRTMLLDHLTSAEPFGPAWLGVGEMIDMGYVRQLIDEHGVPRRASGVRGTSVTRDHSQRLYMLLALSIWAKWLGKISAADR